MFDGADGMKIEANREEILQTLRNNRTTHVLTYLKAKNGWLKEAKDTLLSMHDYVVSVLAGKENLDPVPNITKTVTELHKERPESHVADYDRAIRMLELHMGETITLSAGDVRRYVLDEWDWSKDVGFSFAKYSRLDS